MKENKNKVVVVAAVLQRKQSVDSKVYCARFRALGLTAYGSKQEEADAKLKRMFATWVGLHKKSGTLESALNRSQLTWWYADEYDGTSPYEVVLVEGGVQVVHPKTQATDTAWEPEEELVAAK